MTPTTSKEGASVGSKMLDVIINGQMAGEFFKWLIDGGTLQTYMFFGDPTLKLVD